MKKTILISAVIISVFAQFSYSQCGGETIKLHKPTSIGMVIYSNDVETVWNALRLANFSVAEGDTVSIFLLGKGVELDNLSKSDKNIKEQTDIFLNSNGKMLGCGTCLQSRNNASPQVCKMSSMGDLYEIVRKNKIVMTF